ncbi:late embryogenesis abundant protein D-34-like [Dioscorea cayenensis subsp. rotundata]|uniref:Late embryogenesis abundant protein D-34-like n=1 Tax=Dioscorea cayennensis subsp. rotundata TaxID=55577 RepID=A0AB40CCM9_DIOCR|nr:late embryogenesis abundant protein D-34-like [Dioscorea cayenensis subsp. rotundata]
MSKEQQPSMPQNQTSSPIKYLDLSSQTMQSSTAAYQGVSTTQSDLPSGSSHVITETFSGHAVEQYSGEELIKITEPVGKLNNQNGLTIGEALEAAVITEGSQPVMLSDAAAIKAAEEIITGGGAPVSGGVADQV